MSFKDRMAKDLSLFFNAEEFADEIVYKPLGAGDGSTIMAILDVAGSLGILDVPKAQDRMTILVKSSDVPSPRYQDLFVIGGSTYQLLSNDGGSTTVGTFLLTVTNAGRRAV